MLTASKSFLREAYSKSDKVYQANSSIPRGSFGLGIKFNPTNPTPKR